jgi:hypothetical protein
MPPKAKLDKQKQKLVEDKTFGLKNKNKSAKVNKYVQQVQQQVTIVDFELKRAIDLT